MNTSTVDVCTPLVAWLRALEQDGEVSRFPISRTFDNEDINGYFRSSRFKMVAPHRLVLCIASITIHQPGCGAFGRLLSAIEDPENGFVSDSICVESVFNSRLRDYLLRQGFTAHGDPIAPEFFRLRNPLA